MRIDPDVYLVGSGQNGFDMTDLYDCNVYLLDAGGTYIWFDTGSGMGIEQMLQLCQQDGLDPAKVRHLFLTHAHADHSGGAARLQEQTGAAVYAGPSTARIVASGDEEAISLPSARKAGIYPPDYVYRACSVDHIVEPGSVTEIGQLTIEAIPTPGHSHDHFSYLVRGLGKTYLLGGDAIFFGGKVIWQNIYDCSVPETNASIQRLATFDFEALLPGHLAFSLQRGKRHIEAACAIIDKLGCPLSIT